MGPADTDTNFDKCPWLIFFFETLDKLQLNSTPKQEKHYTIPYIDRKVL